MRCTYSGGHLEIQNGVIADSTIWLAGPKNLGIATLIMFVSGIEPKLWHKNGTKPSMCRECDHNYFIFSIALAETFHLCYYIFFPVHFYQIVVKSHHLQLLGQ
jgi:hypothetical protein